MSFEKFIKFLILLGSKYRHKRDDFDLTENEVVEDFCLDDCSELSEFREFI